MAPASALLAGLKLSGQKVVPISISVSREYSNDPYLSGTCPEISQCISFTCNL